MAPRIGLALGGGGARGIAHIHVLAVLDELGIAPTRIVGSSIGAIMGAGYAAGLSAQTIGDYVTESFADMPKVISRLWQTRPPSLKHFMADGGLRIGQLNAERVVRVFLPDDLPDNFEELKTPLGVMATDFYRRLECELDSGDLFSALAASAAIPAVFRPVKRQGRILIDGGIYNPLPYDRLRDHADILIACDVNGGPEGDPSVIPATMEAMVGASQLMMQSIIDLKVKVAPPDILVRPYVSPYRVLDFMRSDEILLATLSIKDGLKRAIAGAIEAHEKGIETRSLAIVEGASSAHTHGLGTEAAE